MTVAEKHFGIRTVVITPAFFITSKPVYLLLLHSNCLSHSFRIFSTPPLPLFFFLKEYQRNPNSPKSPISSMTQGQAETRAEISLLHSQSFFSITENRLSHTGSRHHRHLRRAVGNRIASATQCLYCANGSRTAWQQNPHLSHL